MLKNQKLAAWLTAHPKTIWVSLALIVLAACAALALPIMRHHEVRQLAAQANYSTKLLLQAMRIPGNLQGEPGEATDQLTEIANTLSHQHDTLVLAHVHFARAAWLASIEYTEFTSRFAQKLLDVGAAHQHTAETMANYNAAVLNFKYSTRKNQLDAMQALNDESGVARRDTDLAYQECVIALTLNRQLESLFTHTEQALGDLDPTVADATRALDPQILAAISSAHALRKQFNPMAKNPY